MIDKDNLVKIITVKYDNGEEKDITKGLIITVKEEGEESNLTFEFANIEGRELAIILYGVIQMGVEMGLLGDGE